MERLLGFSIVQIRALLEIYHFSDEFMTRRNFLFDSLDFSLGHFRISSACCGSEHGW